MSRRRRTTHTARARHTRTRARVTDAERIGDSLARWQARYEAARDGEPGESLTAALDWLRAEVRLIERQWGADDWTDNAAWEAAFAVALVAEKLGEDIRDEARKL